MCGCYRSENIQITPVFVQNTLPRVVPCEKLESVVGSVRRGVVHPRARGQRNIEISPTEGRMYAIKTKMWMFVSALRLLRRTCGLKHISSDTDV